MSEDANVLLQRNGANVVAKPFIVQLDKMSSQEQGGYQGGEPRFTYAAYTTMLPVIDAFLVRQGDLLIDQVNTDPKTKKLRQWRISSDPERFPLDGHWEWQCDLYRGT